MAFVISRGSLTALEPRTTASYFPTVQRGISMSANLQMTYGMLYRRQPQVRTVVSFLARNIAQLGIHTYKRNASNDDRTRVRDSPLARLLDETPNATTTPYRLIYGMIADRAIYDVAFWLKVRGEPTATNPKGDLLGLRRISPRRMTPIDGDWLDVDAYRLTGRNGYRDIPREDLVVFPGYDPEEESSSGSSPIESLRLILAEEFAASQYREQLWRNGARAAGYIRRPETAPEWGKTARERFREGWQAQYAGDGPNAGGTPILEDGMEWIAAGVSPKEAQYVESRMLTREEAAAAYHIPGPMVGLLEHATFSNIEEQHKQLYQDTLGPWTVSSEQEIALQLVPEFPSRGTYVEFNYAEKLRGSFEEQAAGLQGAVGRPYMTPDEARARLNLPHIEGGDTLLVPLNMGNAGGDPADAPPDEQKPDPNADPAADDPSTDDPAADAAKRRGRRGKLARAGAKRVAAPAFLTAHETMLRGFFGRQQRSVLARAGAKARKADPVTAADLFDRARWDRELSADLLELAPGVVADVAPAVLDGLGVDVQYDPAQVEHFLQAQTDRVGQQVNSVSEQQIAAAVEEADGDSAALQVALAAMFAAWLSKRVADIALTQITGLSGFGTVEAARQLAIASGPDSSVTKKWITGQNPRPTHLAMDQQTVAYDQPFSNGAHWPADAAHLDVDEVAGCNCDLEIEFHE